LGYEYNGDEYEFTDDELSTVTIVRDRLYNHKVVRINYTTYDVRREQDSLNPRTHSDIVLYSHEDDVNTPTGHPYWYARIISIFHAEVVHTGSKSRSREPQRMEFLRVRWFGRDSSHQGGWTAKRLHRIGFLRASEDVGAFGFVDPQEVVRAIHLIPAFHFGQTKELLSKSIARQEVEKDMDWCWYYVNM